MQNMGMLISKLYDYANSCIQLVFIELESLLAFEVQEIAMKTLT